MIKHSLLVYIYYLSVNFPQCMDMEHMFINGSIMQCVIEIRNRFAALENLSDDEDIDRTWGNIKEIIKTSAKESLGLHELKGG